ncbi:alpha-xenorhabdolysin family binary toxin subunit A [Xenorhabdus szentirmaii]|uniref:XaxA n=2 Tax=Xenorhabdus szentirmaii TaxID=290112 RepID=W1J0D1_9GAMM|nr:MULTISPECIES: alpha-xenorhabdolysin family binary toxin subunit A [Xenorhabdus]MBD2779568.1 alpha-xenorhabdolysin family binary toxin subunit A [Xenorhabdus sp. 38]MBD2792269.1 alpha-xenorhabdolysin family binary toxin subunit A [Xenorhabdus sp. CUL]MBD2801283.1 alpha-xenorhabdolysin family binary toxin subunit A [Xenorhabdus sp. M]MBD2803942.1 alpha-xenorhabdolysin family binary toxin subunit A [Xenorhabdus sp. ZM]MBD2821012.1 alpha-xenorhabdolysin family binary toxin subunit A [Xenorhabdu
MLLNSESQIPVSEVPSVTLKMLTSQITGVARPGGIFTKEDIISLKLYVKHSLALPYTLEGVKEYIGYNDIDVDGLKPAKMTDLFKEIHDHALSWSGVEDKVQQQSRDLEEAGRQITEVGQDIINNINQMPIIERVKEKLGDLTDKQLAEITYTGDDKLVASALGEILGSMKKDIEKQQENTQKVKNAVSDFKLILIGGELSNGNIAQGLQPQVNSKKKLMDDNHLSTTIKELEDSINEKNKEIEQLKKDYDKYVGLAFSGAVGGIIGWAITGGIFGDKAEKARKRKNELIAEVKKLQDQVKGKSALQEAIQNLSHNFNDIGIRMVDAEVALNHLDFMWSTMLGQINSSKDKFLDINNALSLINFTKTFKQVISPWEKVQGSAEQLIKSFDEALIEYKKIYG